MLIVPRRPEWFQPFWLPGSACRSRFIRIPYLRAHCTALRKYVQHVLAKNGSLSRVSIAQYGNGIRTQFKPAPAISAKSCSVCNSVRTLWHDDGTKSTYNKCLIVRLQLREAAARCICSHGLAQGPLIYSLWCRVDIFLVQCRDANHTLALAGIEPLTITHINYRDVNVNKQKYPTEQNKLTGSVFNHPPRFTLLLR